MKNTRFVLTVLTARKERCIFEIQIEDMPMYENFKDYYNAIRLSPEAFGKYSDREVYDFCAARWAKDHPGSSIPSISDSTN